MHNVLTVFETRVYLSRRHALNWNGSYETGGQLGARSKEGTAGKRDEGALGGIRRGVVAPHARACAFAAAEMSCQRWLSLGDAGNLNTVQLGYVGRRGRDSRTAPADISEIESTVKKKNE
jgi:hypothetical protein